MADKKIAQIGRHQRLLAQIYANGSFYVEDCWPWAIKNGCTRFDCPMRKLAVAPEATADDYFIKCEPVGDLADLLIKLQLTNTPK